MPGRIQRRFHRMLFVGLNLADVKRLYGFNFNRLNIEQTFLSDSRDYHSETNNTVKFKAIFSSSFWNGRLGNYIILILFWMFGVGLQRTLFSAFNH